jgi:hypothetical protein
MLDPFLRLFDAVADRFERPATRRAFATLVASAFACSVVAIELARQGWLPAGLAAHVPTNHFRSVDLAFYLVLAWEVAALAIGLAASVANAAGKQFEVFSLILLRHAFEAFGHLDEPVAWGQARGVVVEIAWYGAGALSIFVTLGAYYGAQRHPPLPGNDEGRVSFVALKKLVALTLLAIYGVLAVRAAVQEDPRFFSAFYTVLVLADVFLVLAALRHSGAYHLIFRNSGLAASTVVLRVALTAPPAWSAALGAGAALFALAVSVACNRFGGVFEATTPRPGPGAGPAAPPPHP